MAEIIQEPVTEQTSNSNELEASVDENNETPVILSKSKTEEKADSPNKTIENKEIDYLSLDLFSGVKQISIDELIDDKEEDVVSEDEETRYKSTLVNFNEKEIITGRIIGINEKDVLIDIGFKSEGIIDRNEFSENNIPEVGEKIEVFLEKIEDESGKTILSKEKADF
jgi:Ribosomal protein S1